MDIAKAIMFVTEDERWIGKIGIGALVTIFAFLIIPIPLLAGYMVGVARNVQDGNPRPLPEWDDWGKLFKDGMAIIAAQIVYTLPFWLLMCCGLVATVGFGGIAEGNEDAAAAGMMVTISVLSCLFLLFAVVMFFLNPAIVVQYVRTDDFGAVFQFGNVFGIARDNIGNILIAFLVTFGASFVLNLVIGTIAIIPCIGWIIAFVIAIAVTPYLIALTGHLYGQIAAQ